MSDCEKQLRHMCKTYAEDASNGCMMFYPDGDENCRYEAYAIQYTIDGSGEYLGCRIMLAGGGPTVWIDTFNEEIQGFWGSDKCVFPIYDFGYIDDYWEERYKCLS